MIIKQERYNAHKSHLNDNIRNKSGIQLELFPLFYNLFDIITHIFGAVILNSNRQLVNVCSEMMIAIFLIVTIIKRTKY